MGLQVWFYVSLDERSRQISCTLFDEGVVIDCSQNKQIISSLLDYDTNSKTPFWEPHPSHHLPPMSLMSLPPFAAQAQKGVS